jgi:hypothetical protein
MPRVDQIARPLPLCLGYQPAPKVHFPCDPSKQEPSVVITRLYLLLFHFLPSGGIVCGPPGTGVKMISGLSAYT